MIKSLIALFLILFAIPPLPVLSQNSKVGELTEALEDDVWSYSEWISAADAPVISWNVTDYGKYRSADGSSWFVSTVLNDKEVAKAIWTTTGLGTYDIFVNGKKVGLEILKPGYTHYAKTRNSYTYDITDMISVGRNEINTFAAEATPGWWADKIITPSGHKGMLGDKPAFRGVLEVTYIDGSKKYYGTNTTDWKAGVAGPVKHAAIFDGEEYDARELPGYMNIEKLSTPEINTEFLGKIVPVVGAMIYLRDDLAMNPVQAYTWMGVTGNDSTHYGKVNVLKRFIGGEEMSIKPGETLVLDFGQNCAALPRFRFMAPEGTQLICLPSEILNDGNGAISRCMDGPEGSCLRKNLRTPNDAMLVKYIFGKSDDYTSYIPSHTFFGYRYLSITADNEVKFQTVESIPVTSITSDMEIGHITTGNESINQLISNTIWSQRSNYLSVPTDCPQRNERLGYTADTQIFAETGSFFAYTKDFMHKWMRDMRDTQSETGSFPGVAPAAQYCSGSMMRLGWADAGVIVPYIVWKQFGDKAIVNDNWEAMDKFMNHVNDTKYNHQTLSIENGNYQWGDWLSYEALETYHKTIYKEGTTELLPEAIEWWNYLGASYWCLDADMMAAMARDTGKDVEKYEIMAKEARKYIREEFLNEAGEFKLSILNDMQSPALFLLRNNILAGESRDNLVQRLRKNFEEHGNCLQTGFLGTSILMETLTDNGMEDMAYELLFQRKNPSWLYSVDNGATTIWERWDSYTKEFGFISNGMNSFNHYAYGCVCEWLWETVAGIASDPANPGFNHIIMKPIPDKRLGYVDARYNSAAGLITSNWKYEGDDWIWEFSIPEGSTASVILPGDNNSTEYSSGKYRIELSDKTSGMESTYAKSEINISITSDKIRIDGEFDYMVLYNISGEEILKTSESEVSTSSFIPGVYIARIIAGPNLVSRKICISK